MFEALIAINTNQLQNFLDNWKGLREDFAPFNSGQDGAVTIDVYDKAFCYVDVNQAGFKENAVDVKHKTLLSILVAEIIEPDWTDDQDPSPNQAVTVLHYLREAFGGSLTIMGCWDASGLHVGTYRDYVENGTEQVPLYENILTDVGDGVMENVKTLTDPAFTVPRYDEVIAGTPIYTPAAKADMLKYMPDDDGDVPASDYKQARKVLGFADRRY